MDIRESVDRVLASEKVFGEIFYEEFFRRTPDAVAYFEGVEMERQAVMLTMALPAVARLAGERSPAAVKYFHELAGSHQQREVPRALYVRWCEAMMAALEYVLAENWTSELAEQWDAALRQASELMVEGYQEDA